MCVGVYAGGVHACQVGLFVSLRVHVQNRRSGLATQESSIEISASQKKKKKSEREKNQNLYIFSKRAAFFSHVNSLNEIYRSEYIL